MNALTESTYFVFSGGGINGYAHMGVWRFLEELWSAHGLSLMKSVQGAGGASVGSIIALAMVLGCTSHELESLATVALNTEYSTTVMDLTGLLSGTRSGLLSSEIISGFVQNILKLKTGNAQMTFRDLKEFTQAQYVCTAHNIVMMRSEYFGTEHTPDVPVWKGVTMSCLNPLFFNYMEHEGGEYYDGGLSNSVPFEVFPLGRTIVSMITRLPGGKILSMFTRYNRIAEAYDTSAKQKILNHEHELASVVRVNIDVGTSEHFLTTGGLCVDDAKRNELLQLGRNCAVECLVPEVWDIIQVVTTLLGTTSGA